MSDCCCGHGPDHQPVGREVERQWSATHAGDSSLAGRQAFDEHVHALVDDGDRLVRLRVLLPLGLHRHVAPREDADPPRALGNGGVARRQGLAAGDAWPGGGGSSAATNWTWSAWVCRRASADSGLRAFMPR